MIYLFSRCLAFRGLKGRYFLKCFGSRGNKKDNGKRRYKTWTMYQNTRFTSKSLTELCKKQTSYTQVMTYLLEEESYSMSKDSHENLSKKLQIPDTQSEHRTPFVIP